MRIKLDKQKKSKSHKGGSSSRPLKGSRSAFPTVISSTSTTKSPVWLSDLHQYDTATTEIGGS